jgi:hypothetical protein
MVTINAKFIIGSDIANILSKERPGHPFLLIAVSLCRPRDAPIVGLLFGLDM